MVLKLETEEIMRINAARFKLVFVLFLSSRLGDEEKTTKRKGNEAKWMQK